MNQHGSANGASGSSLMISLGWAQKGHACAFRGGVSKHACLVMIYKQES